MGYEVLLEELNKEARPHPFHMRAESKVGSRFLNIKGMGKTLLITERLATTPTRLSLKSAKNMGKTY